MKIMFSLSRFAKLMAIFILLFISQSQAQSVSTFVNSGLNNPLGIAIDASGNIFVANLNASTVSKITSNGTVTTFATVTSPKGLAFDASGNLYVSSYGASGSIVKIASNGTTSTFASSVTNPTGLAFDASGNLYVSSYTTSTIYKYTSGGTQSTFATSISSPTGLAFDASGNLFAATNGGTIYKITSAGVKTTFASSSSLMGLAFDRAGNLYACRYSSSGSIYKYNTSGTQSTLITPITNPSYLAFDANGNLYINSAIGNSVVVNYNVTITASASTICAGTSVTFTATTLYAGNSPSYQWKKNGSNIGSNATTYTDAGLSNNDIITCTLTSTSFSSDVISNSITETVNPNLVPALSVSASSSVINGGTPITFTANPTNGGTSPVYQWQLNSSNVGTSNGSILLGGASQKLSMSPGITPGTGAYTVDCWFYLNTAGSGVIFGNTGSSNQMTVYITNMTTISVDDYNYSNQTFTVPTMSLYTWYHLAVVRNSSSQETVFLNGTRSSTGAVTDSRNFSTASTSIGYGNNVGTYFTGNISNLRVVVGSNLYDPTQSSITMPTGPLTVVTNTKLLLLANSSGTLLTDASSVQTVTNSGTSWSAINMFPAITYSNSSLSYGDVISCTMTSNNICQTTNTSANSVAMLIAPTIGTFSNITKTYGDANFNLTAPSSNSAGAFTYTSSNTSVATISGNTVAIVGPGSATITANQAASGNYKIGSTTAILTVGLTGYTWQGNISSDWNTAGNWIGNQVPTGYYSVTIPASANYQPVLTTSTSVWGITLNGQLDINGKTLTLKGAISGSGSLKGAAISALIIDGTVGTVNFAASYNTIKDLTINSGSVTLGNALNITGTFTPTAGTINTNDYLTLKSTSIANSAVVGVVGGTISGNIIVERYIPKSYRAYRDIAPEVYNAGSIFNNWQEGGSYSNNGYGTFITGGTPTAGATNSIDAAGLDKSINAVSSINTFLGNTPSWTAISNTKTTNLNPFQGYRLLIRGDRSFNLFTQPVTIAGNGLLMLNATTLRAKGQLLSGTVTYNTSGVSNAVTGAAFTSNTYGLNTANSSGVTLTGGFSMIANPYVCSVDWSTITRTNVQSYYYYLDPTFGSTGVYVSGNALVNRYIQPGQAIFVQNAASGSPTIAFKESDKAPSSTKTAIFGSAINNLLSITLLKQVSVGATPTYKKMDIAYLAFDAAYSNGYSTEDAPKLSNASDNLSFSEGSYNLSIDGRSMPTNNDVITIRLDKMSIANFQLEIDGAAYQMQGISTYLYDNYTKTSIPITNGINNLSFSVDSLITASYANRFTIGFKVNALAVNSISASAEAEKGKVNIKWAAVGERNLVNYTIEQAADGTNFIGIAKVLAKNTSLATYGYIDKQTASISYYRIKAVSTDGSISYSNIVRVNGLQMAGYGFYPNPMSGRILTVSLTNISEGKYTINILNSLGMNVYSENINNHASSIGYTVTLNKQLAKGIYKLVIIAVDSRQQVYAGNLAVE